MRLQPGCRFLEDPCRMKDPFLRWLTYKAGVIAGCQPATEISAYGPLRRAARVRSQPGARLPPRVLEGAKAAAATPFLP